MVCVLRYAVVLPCGGGRLQVPVPVPVQVQVHVRSGMRNAEMLLHHGGGMITYSK